MKLTEPTIKNDYHKKAFISTICLMTTLMVSATDIWEGSHAVD